VLVRQFGYLFLSINAFIIQTIIYYLSSSFHSSQIVRDEVVLIRRTRLTWCKQKKRPTRQARSGFSRALRDASYSAACTELPDQ
jgi:hypothetical protein